MDPQREIERPRRESVSGTIRATMPRRGVLQSLLAVPLLVGGVGSMAGCGRLDGGGDEAAHALDIAQSTVSREAPGPQAAAAAQTMHRFGAALFGTLAPGPPRENLLFSPYSIASALTMTRLGAAGETARAVDTALSVPVRAEGELRATPGLAVESNSLAQQLAKAARGDVVWSGANSLWGQHGIRWEPEFIDALARWFGAGIHQADFSGDPDGARRAVNTWTASATAGQIREILAGGMVTPLTRLILVNAVYFKAPWASQFDKRRTSARPFKCLDGRKVDVPMMTGGTGWGSRDTERGYSVVTTEFGGAGFAFTAVLPDPGRESDVHTLFRPGMRTDPFREMLGPHEAAPRPQRPPVSLHMPRFSMRHTADLVPVLRELGMGIVFDDGADFSGMSRREKLFISHIAHQATLDVNEFGAEAAATTAVVMAESAAPAPQLHITLDRPFYVVLHDTATNAPLFFGYVADPRSA